MRALLLLALLVASSHAWRIPDALKFNSLLGGHDSADEGPEDDCPAFLATDGNKPCDKGRPHPKPGPRPPHPPHKPGPPFYHGLDGPKFRVLNRTCGYQIREYNHSSWAVTKATGWNWEFAVHHGFGKLAGYFRGGNANHTHFPPTVPLVSHFIPKNNYTDAGKKFLVAAYIPRKFNGSAPAPSSPDVEIRTFPSQKIYVRQFGGLGLHWTVLHETFALARALKRNKVNVTEGLFFAAQYDTPTTLFHRHNEVWWVPQPRNASATASPGFSTLWDDGGLALAAE